jgi:hypothetical protein
VVEESESRRDGTDLTQTCEYWVGVIKRERVRRVRKDGTVFRAV